MCGCMVVVLHLWLILYTYIQVVYGSENGQTPCTARQFYNQPTESCLPCSTCKDDEVTRRPCSSTVDTVCGPFTEFKFFHTHPDTPDAKDEASLQHVAEKTEVHLTIYSEGSGHSIKNIAVDSKESQHWRTVAFALIGALSALIFLGTLVVLVTCKRINQSRPPANPTENDDDADCPYVVIHTIRPSASDEEVSYQVPPGPDALHQLARQRQRLFKYHPKRRLLQANEYADDVFESEDSGSRLRMSLQVIPENEHSGNETDGSPESSIATPTTPQAHPTLDKDDTETTPFSTKDGATDLALKPLPELSPVVWCTPSEMGDKEDSEEAAETTELLNPDISLTVS